MKKLYLTTAICLAMYSVPAYAGDVEMMQQMQKQINALQKQLSAMQAKLNKQETVQVKLQKQVKQKSVDAGDNFKISFKPSPKIESTDGEFLFQPFGRMHLDYAVFSDDKKDHADNANFRRARFGFKGKISKDLFYKMEFDLAKEAVGFKDVSLTYKGFKHADVKIGNFKPVFGLEENTSSNYMQFLERSAPSNTFARDEEIGLAILSGGDNWSFGIGAFSGDAGDTSTAEDEPYTVDVRGSVAPIAQKGRVLHTGLGLSHRMRSSTASFKAKSTGIGTDLVSTGTIAGVDNVYVVGTELAGVYDSLSVQGEYFHTNVNRKMLSDAKFGGWVAQASYLLTGESRPYSAKIGNFKRVKPNNPFNLKTDGIGAWEILARHENLDLNDTGAGITGGNLKNTTLGVNWYLTDNSRLMFNYIDVNTDVSSVVANDDPQIYTLRAAWDF